MAQCICFQDGVANTSVFVGKCIDNDDDDSTDQEIKNITDINHVRFEDKGIRYWRHSDIGAGKYMELKHAELSSTFTYDPYFPKDDQGKDKDIKRTHHMHIRPTIEKLNADSNGDLEDDGVVPEYDCTYQCSRVLCDQRFATPEERDNHMLKNECSLTFVEAAQKIYTSLYSLEIQNNLTTHQKRSMAKFLQPLELVKILNSIDEGVLVNSYQFTEGFALRKRQPNKKFSLKQTSFIETIFSRGEAPGARKAHPEDVEREMRKAKEEDPNNPGYQRFMFDSSEWLTAQQIRGLFGRFTRLRNQKGKGASLAALAETEVEKKEEALAEVDQAVMDLDQTNYIAAITELTDQANLVENLGEQDHPIMVRYFQSKHWQMC